MPVHQNVLIGASGQGSSGYTIESSAWFDGLADRLTWDPSGASGTPDLYCLSYWAKRSKLGGSDTNVISGGVSGYDSTLRYTNYSSYTDAIQFYANGGPDNLITNAAFSDPTAWHHVFARYDSNASGGSSDYMQLWVNGVRLTSFASSSMPSAGENSTLFDGNIVAVGGYNISATQWFDGYLAEVAASDGQDHAATDFGEYDDNGVWVPIDPSGLTYGTNGFLLQFKQTGSGQDASGIGADTSGNNNHFAVGGGSPQSNQVTDTPTDDADNDIGNYATWNPISDSTISSSGVATLSNGNLTATSSSGAWRGAESTINLSASGKIGFELTMANEAQDGFNYPYIGIAPQGDTSNAGSVAWVYGFQGYNGNMQGSGVSGSLSGGGLSANDVVELLIDIDDGTAEIKVNGTSERTDSGLTFNNSQCLRVELYSYALTADFGQSGYNPSESDHKTLNTANLPAPTVTDPSKYFHARDLGAGNDGTRSVTGVGFAPDLIWIKSRSGTYEFNHQWFDIVRGASNPNALQPNLSDAPVNGELHTSTGFGTDGFTLVHDASNLRTNSSAQTYVAWCWKAGGAPTASNVSDSGSPGQTPTDNSKFKGGVADNSAYVSAGNYPHKMSIASHGGFSILTYAGTGSNTTLPHGLDRTPSFFMLKPTVEAWSWAGYHSAIGTGSGNDQVIRFDTNAGGSGTDQLGGAWQNDPFATDDVITFGTQVGQNGSGDEHIMYVWARTPGLIAAGSFIGADAADGSYIVVDDGASGFKPALFIFKNVSGNGSWYVVDSARNPYNTGTAAGTAKLVIQEVDNEATVHSETNNGIIDFVANGVKFRGTNLSDWQGPNTFMYLAFAEDPFGGSGVAQARAR